MSSRKFHLDHDPRVEPHWSRDQADMVEEMQCRRLEDGPRMAEPMPRPEPIREEVRMMTCGVCLHPARFTESRVCEACQYVDRSECAE